MRRYHEKNWTARLAEKRAYSKKYPWLANERKGWIKGGRLERDKTKCRAIYKEVSLLNREAGYVKWNVDHIIPFKHGGKHTHENLQILTAKANQKKGGYFDGYRYSDI